MSGKQSKKVPSKNLDPLFQLFEHYLLTRSYEDSGAFTKSVVEEYLTYLDSTTAHIPIHCRTMVIEDLESETHEMLVKKMYGTSKNTDYTNFGKVIKLDKKDELSTFEFTPSNKKSENDDNQKS